MLPSYYDQIIDHPGAWKAADLSNKDSYAFDLTKRHYDTLDAAVVKVKRAGLTINDIGREEFSLAAIEDDIATLGDEVRQGRGIVLIRGFPVDRYDLDDLETLYWGFGTHFGTAVSQSVLGDRIGHVTDKSKEVASERSYRNSNELIPHTDCNEMIAMLSVRTAKSGGESKYASALTVHNEILRTHPEHLKQLYEGFYYHRRGEEPPGAPPCTSHKVPVFSCVDGYVSARYVPGYLEAAAPELGIDFPKELTRAMAYFDEVACRNDVMVTVLLEPGEMSMQNNFTVLHGRTNFEDHDEPGRERLLLRLWIDIANGRPHNPHVAIYETDSIVKREGARPTFEGKAFKEHGMLQGTVVSRSKQPAEN